MVQERGFAPRNQLASSSYIIKSSRNMLQSRARAEESRLDVERRLKYLGAARVSLDVLRLYWDGTNVRREPSRQHVEILAECFHKEGCHRLKLHNHVPAKISQDCLDSALRNSSVSAHQLLNGVPELTFPDDYKLDYLHGLHRIEAAREFLSETDKWWTVDLYLSDLDTNLETCLIEEYSNEEEPSDGEVYRKIRQYKDNFIFRQRWRARLKKTRARDMTTLLRNEELTEAFDSLLPIYGLWDGMMLTTIHKITPMKCPELITNYLERIKEFYSDLVEGDEHAMQKIDPATVKAIELRAPRASTKDAKFLYSEIHGGRIFSAFSDPEREEIWRRLQTFEGLVPSLYTFFHDILYLELLTDSVRWLTRIPKNKSLIEALQKRFTGVNQENGLIRIQRTEGTFVHREGNRADQIDYGIRQLFAFAMREYPSMPREPKEEDLLQQPRAHAVPSVLHCFADLASDLGFASDEITALKQLGTDARRTYPRSRPILVTSGPGVALSVRCGKPRCRSSKTDRNLLFIDHLHDTRQDQGDGITSFFVRKSVYLAFFGRPSRMGTPTMDNDMEDTDSVLSYYHREDRGRSQEPSGVDQTRGQSQPSSAQEERRQEQRRQEQELQRRLEQESVDQERLERERLERERLEWERLEWERLQQELKQEILNRERLQQEELERERLERERLERERLEQERREQHRQEQLRQEEELQRRLEEERLERERRAQDQHEQEKVEIQFKVWEGHHWKVVPSIHAHPEDSSEVERIVKKYIRKKFRALNTKLQMLAPRDCFQAVIDDRTHTILLVSQDSLRTDEMEESAKRLHDYALRTENISRFYHGKKRR